MKTNKIWIFTLMVPAVVLFIGCDDNNPTAPDPYGSISGTIHFAGDWPATGSVSITLQGDWYVEGPQGPSSYPSAVIGGMETIDESLPTYAYEINNIPYGNYSALVVSWLDPCDNDHASMYHALGAYGTGIMPTDQPFFYSAEAFTINAENRIFSEIDLTADLIYATGIDCAN